MIRYPDLDFKVLEGPPKESFSLSDNLTKQNEFCQLPGGRIFYRKSGPFTNKQFMLHTDMERFTFRVEEMPPISTRPEEAQIEHEAMATDEKNVYVIGGTEYEKLCIAETHIYSVKDDSWTRGPDLNTPRFSASACCLGGFTYIFFGSNIRTMGADCHNLNSIERLDNKSRQAWQLMRTSFRDPIPQRPHLILPLSEDEILINGVVGTSASLHEIFKIDKNMFNLSEKSEKIDGAFNAVSISPTQFITVTFNTLAKEGTLCVAYSYTPEGHCKLREMFDSQLACHVSCNGIEGPSVECYY